MPSLPSNAFWHALHTHWGLFEHTGIPKSRLPELVSTELGELNSDPDVSKPFRPSRSIGGSSLLLFRLHDSKQVPETSIISTLHRTFPGSGEIQFNLQTSDGNPDRNRQSILPETTYTPANAIPAEPPDQGPPRKQTTPPPPVRSCPS